MDSGFIGTLDGPNLTLSGYKRLGHLVRLVRFALEDGCVSTHPSLSDPRVARRLKVVSIYPKPKTEPREPYSPFVEQQIAAAARKEMRELLTSFRPAAAALRHHLSGSAAMRFRSFNVHDLGLLQRKGVLSAAEFRIESLQEAASLRASRAGQRRAFEDLTLEERLEIASRLVAGEGREKLTKEFRLRPLALNRAAKHDQQFQLALTEGATADLELSRRAITKRQADDAAAELGTRRAVIDVAAARAMAESHEPLGVALRAAILTSWVKLGVPWRYLRHANFTRGWFAAWRDPELGIEPIRTVESTQLDRLDDLLSLLAERHGAFGSKTFAAFLDKVELLERAVLGDSVPEMAELGAPTLSNFAVWQAEKGVPTQLPISYCSEKYAPITAHAKRLLRTLMLQSSITQEQPVDDIKVLSEPRTRLFLSQDELTPFIAQLGLVSQIDYGSLKILRRDCLQNSSDGFVDVFYRKPRANHALFDVRVEDGSLETPGGLIRVILEITEPAHLALAAAGDPDADMLWLGRSGPTVKRIRFQHPVDHPWWRFAERHPISDDDGNMLDAILPSRFRKTVKKNIYQDSRGDLRTLTDDHSFSVARDHYADVRANDEDHDDAVTNGLKHALSDAQTRTLSGNLPDEEAAARLSEVTGVPIQVCRATVRGENDTWLAGCLGFRASPYGKHGQSCPTPFTECILCRNSVFTRRKLPNLLAYRAMLIERREVTSPTEWEFTGAPILHVVETEILPGFRPEELRWAEVQMASEADLYIPIELRTA
jgi:hypothetical protein